MGADIGAVARTSVGLVERRAAGSTLRRARLRSRRRDLRSVCAACFARARYGGPRPPVSGADYDRHRLPCAKPPSTDSSVPVILARVVGREESRCKPRAGEDRKTRAARNQPIRSRRPPRKRVRSACLIKGACNAASYQERRDLRRRWCGSAVRSPDPLAKRRAASISTAGQAAFRPRRASITGDAAPSRAAPLRPGRGSCPSP